MRLLCLGLGVLWTTLAVLGFFMWQTASNNAVLKGTPPPLVDVFPMVLLPGIFAAFTLISAARPRSKENRAPDDAETPPD